MHKICVGTDRPHAPTKFLKKEIKQKRFRHNFEIKNRDEIKLKLIFKWNRSWKKLKVHFQTYLKIEIEYESQIHFWNKNHSEKQLALMGHHTALLLVMSGTKALN